MCGGPCHLSSFQQCSGDLIENIWEQLVYSLMGIINIWVLIIILVVIIIISIVNIKNQTLGRCLAQLVEQASHVQRLWFDSRPGSLCCVSLPSLSPCFLFPLQLDYQLSHKRPKKYFKKMYKKFWVCIFSSKLRNASLKREGAWADKTNIHTGEKCIAQ